jgi:type I restriction enzyme, S subunit
MADEWRTVTVRELVDDGVLERPIDGNHGEIHPKTSDFVPSGIPFVMASDLVNGRVDTTHCAFISEERARTLRKGFAKPGDVLISHKATMGRTAVVGELDVPFLMLTPQVTYYRVKDPTRLSNQYLRLYFDSPSFQRLFETWGLKGSTRAYLGITSQLDLPIVLPPPDEQRAIAQILGTLDDKVELNRRISDTLEATARALFKSWFVDFDPVRAKAAGRDPGLPKHLADLFPGRLVDSEVGAIPEGWDVKGLDQIARFVNGLALQKYPPMGDRSLPVIKIAQLRSGRADGEDRASANLDPDYIVADGDILFSWSGSLECVLWAGGPGALNQHLFRVTSSNYPRWLCYFAVHYHLHEFRQIAAGKATTMGHIQRHDLSAAKIAVPAKLIPREVDLRISPLFESLWKRAVESGTLAALRDALLPKLTSGELRLQDVEKFIEKVS